MNDRTFTETVRETLDTQTVDIELLAIGVAVAVLEYLDEPTRARAMRYLISRFEPESAPQ